MRGTGTFSVAANSGPRANMVAALHHGHAPLVTYTRAGTTSIARCVA